MGWIGVGSAHKDSPVELDRAGIVSTG